MMNKETLRMTREEIEADVRMLFKESFGPEALARLEREPAPFKPASEANRFADDLDSLDHVEFIMALEDHFKVEIDDVSAALIKTLEDAVNTVDTRISRPLHGAR